MLRRLLTPLIAACAGLAGLAAFAAGPGTAAPTPPACGASQLTTWLDSPNGTAGTIHYTLHFANLGAACTVRGYPGVSAIGRSGGQLGRAAAREPGKVRTITLAAAKRFTYGTAAADVAIVDTGALPVASCSPVIARGLRVYAPGSRRAANVPYPFGACAKTGTKYLSVGPVHAGS